MLRSRRRRLNKPMALSDLIFGHTRRWKLQRLHRLEVIRQRWPEAAGKYVAHNAAPVSLVRKTLRVAVRDSGWASEMVYISESILERLQALLPGRWVEQIRVVQSEPLPPPEPGEPALVLAEPTTEMEKRVERACAGIEDARLAEAFCRAMRKGLRRLAARPADAADTRPNGQERHHPQG